MNIVYKLLVGAALSTCLAAPAMAGGLVCPMGSVYVNGGCFCPSLNRDLLPGEQCPRTYGGGGNPTSPATPPVAPGNPGDPICLVNFMGVAPQTGNLQDQPFDPCQVTCNSCTDTVTGAPCSACGQFEGPPPGEQADCTIPKCI